MVSWPKAGSPFVDQDRPDGDAAAQPFPKSHDVRLDAKLLVAPEGPCSPTPGLHLVQDEQESSLVAEPPDLLQVPVIRDMHPSFPLNWF